MFESGGDDLGGGFQGAVALVFIEGEGWQPAAKRPRDAVTMRAAMFALIMKLPLSKLPTFENQISQNDLKLAPPKLNGF